MRLLISGMMAFATLMMAMPVWAGDLKLVLFNEGRLQVMSPTGFPLAVQKEIDVIKASRQVATLKNIKTFKKSLGFTGEVMVISPEFSTTALLGPYQMEPVKIHGADDKGDCSNYPDIFVEGAWVEEDKLPARYGILVPAGVDLQAIDGKAKQKGNTMVRDFLAYQLAAEKFGKESDLAKNPASVEASKWLEQELPADTWLEYASPVYFRYQGEVYVTFLAGFDQYRVYLAKVGKEKLENVQDGIYMMCGS